MKHDFSEAEIEFILNRAAGAWRVNKLRPSLEDNFLLTLKSYLRKPGLSVSELENMNVKIAKKIL